MHLRKNYFVVVEYLSYSTHSPLTIHHRHGKRTKSRVNPKMEFPMQKHALWPLCAYEPHCVIGMLPAVCILICVKRCEHATAISSLAWEVWDKQPLVALPCAATGAGRAFSSVTCRPARDLKSVLLLLWMMRKKNLHLIRMESAPVSPHIGW